MRSHYRTCFLTTGLVSSSLSLSLARTGFLFFFPFPPSLGVLRCFFPSFLTLCAMYQDLGFVAAQFAQLAETVTRCLGGVLPRRAREGKRKERGLAAGEEEMLLLLRCLPPCCCWQNHAHPKNGQAKRKFCSLSKRRRGKIGTSEAKKTMGEEGGREEKERGLVGSLPSSLPCSSSRTSRSFRRFFFSSPSPYFPSAA